MSMRVDQLDHQNDAIIHVHKFHGDEFYLQSAYIQYIRVFASQD